METGKDFGGRGARGVGCSARATSLELGARSVMRFGILGPFEVADNRGRELALGGRKQRSVLAILLLHAGEVVSSERLIDELWGERAPASAAKIVQVYVSKLRKALGDGLLLTRRSGYVLQTEGVEVDVDRFERLATAARDALRAGDPRRAADCSREALGLWRGTPLADFAYEPFAQSEIARLEEIRLAALEDRGDAELALGDHAALVGELEGLVRAHPLRERLRGQLMLALYRAGRQTDALAAYRDLSSLLRDELGLEPSESLQELERSILRHDATLNPAAPSPRSADRLPVPATPFLGRARELAEATALLHSAGTRLLTMTGAGGSGKTRLALRVAQTCAGLYRDGVSFVGFADITDPELITPTICQALGLAEHPGLTPTQRLGEWLAERELLLLLDNLEQLTPGTAVLAELLSGCQGLTMIVTSREPLHLAGERQYEVPALEHGDASELFITRAQAVAPRLSVDPDVVGAICERLDRLPLAIELTAARAKILSPIEILARLERRLPVLAIGPRDAPARQRTLRAAIDWSYDLLTEEERRLFTRLSVFAGGCTLSAAEAVCDAELDTLGALVDRSLLRADEGRYWMLQTVRDYALEGLESSDEAGRLRRVHAGWLVGLLQEHGFDKHTPASPAIRAVLAAERENLRAALEWAEQAGEIETVARIAAPLSVTMWVGEGRLSEAHRWLRVARERLAEYPVSLQATVLTAARDLANTQGDHDEGAALCEQALAIYRELGDAEGIFWETMNRAHAPAALGDLAGERAAVEAALLLAREPDRTRFLPMALTSLGDVEIADGRLDKARALCEEAFTLAQGRDPTAPIPALMNLAHIANLESRYGDAADLAREALSAALRIEYGIWAASAAMEIAWSRAEQRQPERAARLLGAAIEFFRHAGAAAQRTDAVCEEAVRDALRVQLDERAFHALLDEGRTMSIEEAAQEELEASSHTWALGYATA